MKITNNYSEKYIPEMVDVENFKIGKYPITFAQYDIYCEDTGIDKPDAKEWREDSLPVSKITWSEAVEYCKWLSVKTSENFRLPTEEEWKYAANGGSKSKGYKYSGSNNLDEVGWFKNNSKNKIHIVGLKKPNELEIHDMSGNIWEWLSDWSDEKKKYKLLCGGACNDEEYRCTIEYLNGFNPDDRLSLIGFRVVQEE